MPRFTLPAILASLLMLPTMADAERYQRFGDYEMHYNAVATGSLDPEIARRHEIKRSRTRALLTVALRRAEKPVGASMRATATNLAGQERDVGMREVRDGEAIYYIGTFAASEGERLDVDIEASPLDSSAGPFHHRFVYRFYAE